MLTVTDGKRLTACLYDTVAEPMDLAARTDWKVQSNKDRSQEFMTSDRGGQQWLGAPTIVELNRRLREGWPEGSERLLTLATRDINPVSIRRRRERADQGAELDIHAVYRGDLSRAWTRCRKRQGSGVRSVTIVVNIGANAGVKADQMFWRGAAALKLASALTESGYSVAIIGAESAQNMDVVGKHDLVQCVEIKAEDQPLDLDRLAALTAMPGYFRTGLFAGICWAADRHGLQAAGGLGQDAPKLIHDAVKLLPVPQHAFIQGEINSQKAAEEWIDSVLGQIEDPELQAA